MAEGALDNLVDALCRLPGVGPKSAQRMALHLLQRDRSGGRLLSAALATAMRDIQHCQRCRVFTEQPVCHWCSDSSRDDTLLCVVEQPGDLYAIDRVGGYRGRFFLLLGHLSPLDGIGPDELGMDLLDERMREGQIKELILATSATLEGQATARYIAERAEAQGIDVMQLARGIPLGTELEYADSGTLALALSGRKPMSES